MTQALSPAPLRDAVRPTTVFESPRLSHLLGVDLTIASETLQYTGSFKFRAAYNVASTVPQTKILTASSGNFGQAVAFACRLIGKSCVIVMPDTSARVKIEAIKEYGGEVDLTDVRVKGRNERVAELTSSHPDAYIASAYDDPLVIQGNATLGHELAGLKKNFDVVIAPVGGGGLTSGLITGLREAGSSAKVFGAEPLIANDAARSLRAGQIIVNEVEPQTIADGARTPSLGAHNWKILERGLAGIVEVPEERIIEGVRLFFSLANLKVEPTGALGLGALLTAPEQFRGLSVCVVVSGGNVDPDVYRRILG
jgi:threonine dehydratase